MRRNLCKLMQICILVLCAVLIVAATPINPASFEPEAKFVELNGNFSKGDRTSPSGWHKAGNAGSKDSEWKWPDPAGENKHFAVSLKTASIPDRTIGWVSRMVPISGRNIFVSGRVKCDNVVAGKDLWHRATFTVQMFDHQRKYIGHNDVVRLSGSHDWRQYSSYLFLPEQAKYLQIILGLSLCSGKVWFADIKLGELPDETKFYQSPSTDTADPIIFPKPLSSDYKRGSITGRLHDVIDQTGFDLSLIHREISSLFNDNYKLHKKPSKPFSSGSLRLVLGPVSLAQEIYNIGDGAREHLKSLSGQGYLLHVDDHDSQRTIVIAASQPIGFYYALQTLSQLIKRKGDIKEIQKCTIIDKPAYSARGIATGTSSTPFLNRMKTFKFNKIVIHGLPGGAGKWNKPLETAEQQTVRNIVRECRQRFITPNIVIWPGGYGKAMRWSSVEDRNAIVNNIRTYVRLGIHEFTLFCPSDYIRVGKGTGIVYEDDKTRYKRLEDAHTDLIRYIYDEINKSGIKAKLYLYPFYYYGVTYYGEEERRYLKALGKLPAAINFLYSGEMTDAALMEYKTITGRMPSYRSVYFSRYEKEKPIQIYPFTWDASPNITQFTDELVFETPFTDMMFYMAADYAWNASHYQPYNSAFAASRIVRQEPTDRKF